MHAIDVRSTGGGRTARQRHAWGTNNLSARAILVVGTSEVRRARNVALLTHAGYEVADLESLDQVVDFVAREAPALVVLDFEPSDAAALGLCRGIKQEHPDTFILQISQSFAKDPDAAVEIESCIDAYLVDPIDAQEMLVLVRSLLRLQKVEADLRDSEDRLLLAQESAGLAILDWMISLNTFVHSDNFVELFDLDPGEGGQAFSTSQLLERIHPDDLAVLIAEFTGENQPAHSFDKEFRIVCRDGRIRWIASRGRFFSGSGVGPERMVSLNFDITQRKTAERANSELASIVASSIDAIVSIDLVGNVTSWNAGAYHLFNVPAEEMIGQPLGSALADMSPQERDTYHTQLTDGSAHEFEARQVRRDGATIDIGVTSAPMSAPDGRTIGASLIIRDISVQKQREDHIRFLMRELTHRSKNLLAVIQAMAHQSMTRGISPEEFVSRFTERLAGLAGSHDLLSSVDWKGVSLMNLIRSQLNHYEELFGTRILLEGTDLVIKPEAAQNVGIALHELSTNAAKYGALSNDDGQVTVSWSVDDSPQRLLKLAWQESGGPIVRPPTRRGFGHVVMDRIAGRALGGKSALAFEPEGVVWTLEVPASTSVVSAH